MKEIIPIRIEDIKKTLYFITSITQKNTHSMRGALNNRGDLMGGILDRFINLIPESVIFNKQIIRDIGSDKSIEVITDYYLYDPKVAGISPDVIGLRIDGRTTPFVKYDNEWKAIDGRPQIEFKTFKRTQKMVSLRNQNYDDKYLIMVESDFRIDYLLPCLKDDIFAGDVFESMKMDDETFIVADDNNRVTQIEKISTDNTEIGRLNLLKVTISKDFMDVATHCEGGVSVQYVNGIDEHTRQVGDDGTNIPLSVFVRKNQYGLYSFTNSWYSGVSDSQIPYFSKKNSNAKLPVRTLDVEIENLEAITVVKKNNSATGSLYVKITKSEGATINGVRLEYGKTYKISFACLNRAGNDGDEYFIQKSLMQYVPDYYEKLLSELREIVDKN